MSIELTFKSVCATIKKQGKEDPKLIEAVDHLLGLTLICAPFVLGPTAVALLPTLAVKNEIIKISKSVFDKLTKKKDEDYFMRDETMRTAYGLLVFTSFFDALDSRLPEALRKEIRLLESEKAFLAQDRVKHVKCSDICETHEAPLSTVGLSFPHPTETLNEQSQRQTKLWKQMGQGFVEFVQKLAFWENADEKKRGTLLVGLENIEEEAAKRFDAQYFELSRKYEDFAVWANLQAHKDTTALIGDLSDYVKQYAKLSTATEKTIDVGFEKLREAVLSIPETFRIEQATEIANSFNRYYQARINEPIIEDKDMGAEDAPRLAFPKVRDAFVPQAFRVLRQTGQSRRLEDESSWSNLPRRNDLGAFLLSFISSPYSTDAPLLILGHPGSGKSLLTTILSAQLMSKQFTVIRVPLREVNADGDIQAQIEEFIKRISGVSFDSWIKLRSQFKNCPPLVILDGYDELLQASGQVFASYIMDAQRFQQHQSEQERPLRIIITSRVTLIDKAFVPAGSTIVRLLEFDQHQRECWTGIWNKANTGYFLASGIEKFALPDEKEEEAEKILILAEQPLLLLMLALYDSHNNQLKNSKGLDRTKLYDSLLRRFVIRERGKEKGFNDVKAKEQEKALSTEMQRLGVAALGMYNRRKLHILSAELDDDLAFFKLEREVPATSGKALSQADLLLGSFFFVHKSKAQYNTVEEDTHKHSSAFEFLHNTFGEFLTADFIIRRAVSQVLGLRAAESNENLIAFMDNMMGTADGFGLVWFASLVYTPLFTRPVIMEMIREWTPKVLHDNKLSEGDFVETLEKIVLNQIKRLLSKREMPQIMQKDFAQEGFRIPFGDHPLVGHIAIYSINLVLLRLVSCKVPFVFDECEIASHEDGTRPWDRLMHIWRSWFSLGNLNGLTAVMVAVRNDSKIKVSPKAKFQAEESMGKLHEFYNVALSLGDNISAGIAGLYLFDPVNGSIDDLTQLEQRLDSEKLDLVIPVSITKLLVRAHHYENFPAEFFQQAHVTLELVIGRGRPDQLEAACQIIVRIIDRNAVNMSLNVLQLFDPQFTAKLAMLNPRCGRIIFGIVKQYHDSKWLFEFTVCFLRFMSDMEMFEQVSENSFEWLRLLLDIGEEDILFRYIHIRSQHLHWERRHNFKNLMALSEYNPELALAYIQIQRKMDGSHFDEFTKQQIDRQFIDRMFYSMHQLKLIEHNPEIVLAYIQILRELGGVNYFMKIFGPRKTQEFIDQMLHPQHLLEVSKRNSDVALAYLKILQELGGMKIFGPQKTQEFINQMLHPQHLLEFSKRN
ncbi:MAG: ATP-binding protein, partial [Chlorobium sp.]